VTRYVLSPAARRDITDIWLYTADRWGVDQADEYVAQIEENLRKVAAGLRIAQPFDGLWKIRSGHHLCLFAKEADDLIWVIRILHERMDVKTQINTPAPSA
jgi:toxin ParE1/3/4